MWSGDVLDDAAALPRHEAERLLAAATGRTRTDVKLGFKVNPKHHERYLLMVRDRLANTPLQYLEGSVPFAGVEIDVDQRVLVPRPETEYMFELLAQAEIAPETVVDLCTGSGNLAVALKARFPAARVFATDISPGAVELASTNALKNEVDVDVRLGNLFDPLPGRLRNGVDLVVANPPYLATAELGSLPADVLNEPHIALVSGPDGDEAVAAIAADLARWLAPEGVFAIEVSEFHVHDVLEYFAGLEAVSVRDHLGVERFVMSRALVE